MQVRLNSDKHDVCFIGRYHFTFEDEAAVDITLQELTPIEKVQMYAAWKNGKLLIDNADDLEKAVVVTSPTSAQPTNISTPIVQPTVDEKALRKLLREKISLIKETLPTLSIKELKALLELEKVTKNRKQITDICSDIIDEHTKIVVSSMGDGNEEDMFKNNDKTISGGLSVQQYLDSVSDVVESDIEEVIVNLDTDSEE